MPLKKRSNHTFGGDDKKHVVNGPKLKAMLRHKTLLADLIKAMRPLYEMMEAKDHASVRPPPRDLFGDFEEAAADAIAAEMTAATGAGEPLCRRWRRNLLREGELHVPCPRRALDVRASERAQLLRYRADPMLMTSCMACQSSTGSLVSRTWARRKPTSMGTQRSSRCSGRCAASRRIGRAHV